MAEKVAFPPKQPKLGDRKCIGDRRKSFIRHPEAILFLRISRERVFQQPRLISINNQTRSAHLESSGNSLSNGFSRKLENHAAATALNYFAYNFIKIHRTLRTSPAMAAGVTDRLWDVADLVALWESYEQRRAERAA